MADRVSELDGQRSGPPFSGVTIDRAADERHDPAWVTGLLSAPGSRAVLASADGVVVDDRTGALRRVTPGPEALLAGGAIVLGLEHGEAVFALDLERIAPALAARLTDGGRVIGLREAGATLGHAEAGLAAYLTALLGWHRRHSHCANCGAATDITEGGLSRHCPACGAVHFPRTDPVVIMLVEHDDRLLLGRRSGWPEGRYSVLAGFVSPGESAEEAVIREVREESGIEAADPRFVTSQPWPFPCSLMLGFEARSPGGEPVASDGELAEVHWFTRDAVRSAALAPSATLALPPPISIARILVDRWLEGAPLRP